MAITHMKFLFVGSSALASLFPYLLLTAGQVPAQDAGPPPREQSEPPGAVKVEESKQRQKAKAEADKQQQRGADKAKAEADKQQQREADKAKADAEKQQQREADKAKADAKQQQRGADKAKAEADKQQQREADKAKAEADKQQREADKAKAEADKQQQGEADKAKAEADKQQQGDAEKAKAEADKQQQREADKAKAEADKQQQRGADKAKAEADKQQQREADKAKAEADKQQQSPLSGANTARDGARLPVRRFEAATEKQAVEQLNQERAKANDEFEKAKREADQQPAPGAKGDGGELKDRERRREGSENKFEELRKQRSERVENGGQRAIIEEPDKRAIVIEKDRSFIRHDETRRFARTGKELKRERQKDGSILTVNLSFGGVEILTLEDEQGNLLRRSRRGPDRREIVLVDNRHYRSGRDRDYFDAYVDLRPPNVRIPREKYVVDYDDASEDDIYEALSAPPVERLERGYSLDEVRQSRWLRERMRRVDLNAINFAFASWEVDESEYPKLERAADAIKRVLNRNPDEMFLIEGHTDAVGSDLDNLSLSDRRAESVAIVLSDTFRVPPENLTTQGYGEQYLKVPTEGPSRENRRVAVRRITPLLSRAERDGSEGD
jgi:outer membrane protein OmpA-like peptidoglycan-associated protein